MNEKKSKYKILIADDSETDVEILMAGIENDERELIGVYRGRDVLKYVEQEIPDLILLDVIMPDMDGYQVCNLLKQDGRTTHIPIIFLTSLADTEDVTKGLELGAVDYIVKPYNVVEINARIKNQLDLQQGHKKSLNLLKNFASSISNAAIIMDEEAKILELFGDYRTYFPELPEQFIHTDFFEYLPIYLKKQFITALESVIETKENFEFETEIIASSRFIIHVTMSMMDSLMNNKKVFTAHIQDITNRRQSERKVDLTYEYQKRSRFFNSVLTGGYSQEQQNQLLSVYGIENQKPLVCYVISTSLLDETAYSPENIRASIGEWLIEKGYGWIWNGNFGIGMLMQYPSSMRDVEKVAGLLKESMEMRFPKIVIRVGISTTRGVGLNFKQLYYDALAALMMSIDENRDVASLDQLKNGLYEVIVHIFENMDVERFIDNVLGKIIQHDCKNGSELLLTLEQLIFANSIKGVAANLFIHPNTVLWRKQKIEEILEASIDDINVRTQINLALKLIHIKNFIKKDADFWNEKES